MSWRLTRMGRNFAHSPSRILLCTPLAVGLLVVGAGSASGTDRPSSGPSVALTGAGSTFDAPFFSRAFYQYDKTHSDVTISYSAIGSSGGIQQLQGQTVNFGATDVPLDAADQAGAGGGSVIQVPIALGGEAISYNLRGVASGLRLTGAVLAEIYLGKITNWQSRSISILNPGVHLPNEAITVVHRSEGSGTTYIFTNYLSTVSSAWLTQYGAAKTINWPVGVGGQGNSGVATLVQTIPGAIGYVELAYALQAHFTYCRIRNAAGQFVLPKLSSVSADAAMKPHITASNFSIVNEPGSSSYPISGYSWVIVYKRQTNTATGAALVAMLSWLTHGGQKYAKALDYVPLPAQIQKLASQSLAKVVAPNGRPGEA